MPKRSDLALFFYFVFMVAMVCSKTLLTIAMIGLLAVGVLDIRLHPPFRLGFNSLLFENLKQLKSWDYGAIIGLFALVALSGINSESLDFWSSQVRLKLPFLLLPLAFINLPKLSARQFRGLLYAFVFITVLAAFGTVLYYLSDYEYITERIYNGTPIPTPIHHIRFSLLIAFATVCAIWLRYVGFVWRYDWERHLMLGFALFLFGVAHFLSVRTGLLTLYAALGVFAIFYVLQTKKIGVLLGFIGLSLLLPLVAYQTIPTFRNKVDYIRYDIDMFSQGNLEGFSDGQRLISLQMGWAVFQKNKTFGTGFGDLKKAIAEEYKVAYPTLEPKLPHNQFLLFGAAMGWIGLLAFTVLFFLPFWHQGNYRLPIFTAFYTIITLSFLFENTLSTAFGTAIYLFFLLLMLQRNIAA